MGDESTVLCPYCLAQPGEVCRTVEKRPDRRGAGAKLGGVPIGYPHVGRLREWLRGRE